MANQPHLEPGTVGGNRAQKPRLRAPGAGRPRKSAALHALEGTRTRARQLGRNYAGEVGAAAPSVPVDRALLRPPHRLPRDARVLWRELAPRLVKAGRLQVHHLSSFEAFCESWSTYLRACRAAARCSWSGDSFPPALAIRRQAQEQVRAWSLRFGLDPASDVRLSAIDGSNVDASTPAIPPATGALEEDRGAVWLRTYGEGG